MGTVLELAVAIALPTAIGYALVLITRSRGWLAARRPPSPEHPIERLGSDLRRLHDQVDVVENAVGLPGKNVRRTAVRAAYVDALSCACRQLGVPPPVAADNHAMPITEIYRAEAALRSRGLDVRGAVST